MLGLFRKLAKTNACGISRNLRKCMLVKNAKLAKMHACGFFGAAEMHACGNLKNLLPPLATSAVLSATLHVDIEYVSLALP